jgi:nitroimidazol reductase NimA-like FMN-containing flavoprotein (pyridoxamine 5'-phosphate oxidase superfamily)
MTRLVELSHEECLVLLAAGDIGRIAVVEDGAPLVFPISYWLTKIEETVVITVRTRTGGVIDHLGSRVAFEIDGIDPGHDAGWSVLVRGVLAEATPDTTRDEPTPLLPEDRDAWRVIVPTMITGRRLRSSPLRWTFNPSAYL